MHTLTLKRRAQCSDCSCCCEWISGISVSLVNPDGNDKSGKLEGTIIHRFKLRNHIMYYKFREHTWEDVRT